MTASVSFACVELGSQHLHRTAAKLEGELLLITIQDLTPEPLIAVAIWAIGLSVLLALYRRHTLSKRSIWWNVLQFPGAEGPAFLVGAFAVGGHEPTVGYCVRVDDPTIRMPAQPSWWKNDGSGYIFVENRRVPHLTGRLQLFVAVDDEKPTCVMLDREDAEKYFGIENTEFINAERGLSFWNDVLQKKYLPTEMRNGR